MEVVMAVVVTLVVVTVTLVVVTLVLEPAGTAMVALVELLVATVTVPWTAATGARRYVGYA